MPRVKADPERIEQAKAFKELGWSNKKIAEYMGIDPKTVARYLAVEDPPALKEQLEDARKQFRKAFIYDAREIVLETNKLVKERLARGGTVFRNAKEAATLMGIYMDKINVLEAANKRPVQEKPAVTINILPPDGYTVEQHTISDDVIEGEVLGDDSGSGEWQDVRSLPEGGQDLAGEPRDLRDDSSIDVS